MPLHLPYPARQDNAAPAFTLDMNKRVQLLQKLAFSESNPGADAVMAQDLLKDIGAVYGLDFLSEEARANRRDLPSLPEREKDEIRMEMQILASRENEPTREEIWQAFEDAFNRHETHRLEGGKFHSKALRIFGENAGAFADGALQSVPLYQKLKEALDIDEDKDLTDENIALLTEKADQLIGVVTDAASGDFSADDIKELLGVSVMSTDVLNEMSLQLTQIKGALTALRAPVKQAGRHGDQWKRDEAKKIFHAFGAATGIAAKVALNTALPETNAAKLISFAADALTADSDDEEWIDKRVNAATAAGKKAEAIIENWEADTRLSALNAVTHKEREQRRRAKYEQAFAVLERAQKEGDKDFSIAERGLIHALRAHGIRSAAELGTAASISAALRGVPYFSFVRDADGNLARMIRNPDGGFVFRDPLMTKDECAASVAQMYPQRDAKAAENEKKDILADHAKGVAEEVKGNLLEKAYESMLNETAAKAAGSFLTTESLSNIRGRFDHKRALRQLTLKEKDYLEKRKTFSKIAKEAQVRVLLDKIAANEALSEREKALAADLDTLGIRSAQDLKQHDALLAVQVMESPHFAVRAKDNSVLSGLPDAVMSAKETQIRCVLTKKPREMTEGERLLYDALKKINVRKTDDLADNKFGTKIKKLSLACELDNAYFECRNGKVVMKEVPVLETAEEYRAAFLGKYIAPAHILLTHEDKREAVKAYEDERLLITLERVGERQLAVAKAREIEMQQEKMQTRDKREAQALAVLEKAANRLTDKLQTWEKVLLVKLNQADIRAADDMSVKGGAVGAVNRDFIRRGLPSFNAEPVVAGGFETLNETHLSPCEKRAFARIFNGKTFVRAVRAKKAEIKNVKPVENVKTPAAEKTPEKVAASVKTPEKVAPAAPTPPAPVQTPEKVVPASPTPPIMIYAETVFAKAEANQPMSPAEQVFLGASLANGLRSAEDLKNPDALQILQSGMGGALNGASITPENVKSLKLSDMKPMTAHGLMVYMANRANLPALRLAQAKGVMKKAAQNEPMCEWEYALCRALNANDVHTAADLEIEDFQQIVRDGMGLTCGGFDRLSVEKLPGEMRRAAKDGLAAVRDRRENQARAVLQKMQNHEKLAGAEIVLSAMLASSGIDGVEKLADEKCRAAVRNGLTDCFVRIGYSEDFSGLDAAKIPPEAAHATMMYMEASRAQRPQADKAEILKKYAEAMSRVDIYERAVELPRELARQKQTAARSVPLAPKIQNAR